MTPFLEKLKASFFDPNLFLMALTHTSYVNEHQKDRASYERLEFLGDSVLGICVSDYLYRNYPKLPEGELSRLRSAVVCENSLAEVATRLQLGSCIYLGKGERQAHMCVRKSILADVVEAIIGAVYLDAGMEKAQKLVLQLLEEKMRDVVQDENHDYKTRLQEEVQRYSRKPLSYRVIGESGLEHEKQFTVVVEHEGRKLGTGTGRNKKEAEQKAAHAALLSANKK